MSTSTLDQLKAQAAIHMLELTHTQDGLICRQWPVTRRFETLVQVAARLDQFDTKEVGNV